MSDRSDGLLRQLRAFGLSLPGAHGKAPWPTHDDLAVNDRTFTYLPTEGEPFSLSCKLPYSGEVALDLPYASPTAYGLGRSGWVTFTPSEEKLPPFEQLKEWVEESYRAQAPRRLVKELDDRMVP